MKSPCVSYPPNEPLVLIRTTQVRICEGNHCAAALLSYFEYWHTVRVDQMKQAEHTNKVAAMHGDVGTQDTSLYQYHTEEDLEAGLLHLYKRQAIRAALALLESKQFLSIHQNPVSRYRFDRTRYFLFHPENVQLQVIDISHQGKIPHGEGEIPSWSGEIPSWSGEIPSPIAEITPEITAEIKPPPLPSVEEPPGPMKPSKVSKRGGSHFVPEDFIVTQEMHAKASEEFPGVDIDHETAAFRDYEFARLLTDWPRAWRNWLRRAPKLNNRLNGLRPSVTAVRITDDDIINAT